MDNFFKDGPDHILEAYSGHGLIRLEGLLGDSQC